MTKLVRDLMHPGVLTCRPDATLGQVAVLLNQHHVHALIVADRDGRPLGIISDVDLLAGEWLSVDSKSLATMRKLTAADLMSRPVDSVEADLPLTQAVRALMDKDVGRLLVTDGGRPAGVISLSDFVASIAKEEKPRRETVADVMSDAILVCRDKTPIYSAARTMTQAGWRSVLVVDVEGVPQGVLSGKDLLPFVKDGVDESLTVRDVMHAALTIDINASLRQAADLMIQKHYHRLVVIDAREPAAFPLGIISSFDIVAEMSRPGSIWQS
ncbi:MAG TPA: CBS domain-containing protein [Anaerolineales bacterium]|nr:CBS domain-containing protein [Anaerolineales bacterium]